MRPVAHRPGGLPRRWAVLIFALAFALAVSAVTAASALSAPEFVAAKYPVKVEGTATNTQGFGNSVGSFAVSCETASASTGVEGIANPTNNSPSLTVHPIYGNTVAPTGCILTLLGTTSGEAIPSSEGCQYVFHAAPPGKAGGTTDISCGVQQTTPTPGNCKVTGTAGEKCRIRFVAGAGLPTGCVISLPAQTALKNVEYKNEPAGEVKLGVELSGLETLITAGCAIGKTEAKSEYRESEVKEGKAKLAAAGKPAFFQTKGKFGTEADPIEVVETPSVTSVEPKTGPAAGGTSVTITGNGFSGATAVKFGPANATSFTVNSESSITATSPAGTGTVDVTVTTPAGTSPISSADQFRYGAPTILPCTVTVTQTSARLCAIVNPNGSEVSECRFEYGTTTSYGSSLPCTPAHFSGSSPVEVSAEIESLSEATTYHFRVVVTNAGGTSFGSDETFKTLLVLGPHWYANGVRLGEGTLENGQSIFAWGHLTLSNTKVGAFTCQTLVGGDLANPTGGGAGKGAFETVTLYDCEEPTCEGAKGLPEVIPEKLEWPSVLIEEAGGVFRDRIEGIALRTICVGGAGNVEFHGMLKPNIEPGTSIGSAPSKLEFGAGSGSLESVEGGGTVAARLKLMGFEGGEIIRPRNT